jgi:hypothetical protein
MLAALVAPAAAHAQLQIVAAEGAWFAGCQWDEEEQVPRCLVASGIEVDGAKGLLLFHPYEQRLAINLPQRVLSLRAAVDGAPPVAGECQEGYCRIEDDALIGALQRGASLMLALAGSVPPTLERDLHEMQSVLASTRHWADDESDKRSATQRQLLGRFGDWQTRCGRLVAAPPCVVETSAPWGADVMRATYVVPLSGAPSAAWRVTPAPLTLRAPDTSFAVSAAIDQEPAQPGECEKRSCRFARAELVAMLARGKILLLKASADGMPELEMQRSLEDFRRAVASAEIWLAQQNAAPPPPPPPKPPAPASGKKK